MRLPRFGPEVLSASQRELYDLIVGGPRQSEASFFSVADAEGVLSGPYRAMLLHPGVGGPLERLGRAARFESGIDDRLKEVAILTVAHLMSSDVEWAAHAGLAAAAGVPRVTIETLRTAPVFEDVADREVYDFVVAMIGSRVVPEPVYNAILDRHDQQGLFALVVVAGYYQMIAHINNVFALEVGR
ncbi:carboxymuconolactone decarboxylase family protein [Microbacterium pseudoresistens]|uniref:Alkylhydroperoxidase family enzyme n=1 Tax=Microbacterium pseudoresistens TaxID=640634 RepID=A0A7Y9EUD3_9MICO|nr:carboxymuconolactone decarboxylase family protein [Microbacterium pseudoresistens]NYD53974.1 alkylhydroperoxidase family enzyme [Microbacterium pseudoresistens]